MAMFFSIFPYRNASVFQGTCSCVTKGSLSEEKSPIPHHPKNTVLFPQKHGIMHSVLAALSYLGPLCIIPYFTRQKSHFAYRHAIHGMNLLLTECAYMFLCCLLEYGANLIAWKLGIAVSILLMFTQLFFLYLTIYGIRAAILGKVCKLPIVSRIKIIRK